MPRIFISPGISDIFAHMIKPAYIRVDTHRLKGQVVVVEPADEKLKAELEKEVN